MHSEMTRPTARALLLERPTAGLAAAALLLGLAACQRNTPATKTSAAPQGAPGLPDSRPPDSVVATIQGQPITAGEVDSKASQDLQSAQRQFAKQVRAIRTGTLETLIGERLLDMEAKARGLAVSDLLKQEVEAKVPPPSDQEVQMIFEQFVRPRRPDMTLEQARPLILEQMVGQKREEVQTAFVEQLKAKYQVENLLAKVDVEAVGPSKGPQNAPVTIVEFSDFECPFCSRAAQTINEVLQGYGDKVRLVFRNYPLEFHTHAPKAAEAALCAGDQGKFWEMHDRLFAAQGELAVPQLKQRAQELGLDQKKFDACLDGGAKAEQVQKDKAAGEKAGVEGTPAFFVNGRMLAGALPAEEFKKVIDAELAKKGAAPQKQ